MSEGYSQFFANTLPWMPIETAPKDGTLILGWDRAQYLILYWAASVNHYAWRDANFRVASPAPTHWTPLPDPPKDAA